MANANRGGGFRRFLVLLSLAGIAFGAVAAFRAGPPPTIVAEADLPGIGKRTTILIEVREPKRGLSEVRVEFVQDDRVKLLESRHYTPIEPWAFWGPRSKSDELTVVVGRETLDELKEGSATIRVVAERAGSLLRSPQPAVFELELPVKLRPPVLEVLSHRTYVAQGGCEAVVYRVGKSSIRDGVQTGDHWFPGFPMPGSDPQHRFALFGAPFDLEDAGQIVLRAFDDVGNEASAAFVDRFSNRPFKQDTIRVSDKFMARVVPAILGQTPELRERETLLASYLAINNELRAKNSATLVELAKLSVPEFLWDRTFVSMPNAQVMSDFADRRTYIYDGKPIDKQDHLGYDLASTRMAEIPAANDGVVVLAQYFGIYGNAVVIDHGYGLMSLYGHLSSIAVEQGQAVVLGELVGRSGATGLAGGDHLHFTMLLQGLPVNPKEWWDGHWIHDRLALKLEAAMPFTE